MGKSIIGTTRMRVLLAVRWVTMAILRANVLECDQSLGLRKPTSQQPLSRARHSLETSLTPNRGATQNMTDRFGHPPQHDDQWSARNYQSGQQYPQYWYPQQSYQQTVQMPKVEPNSSRASVLALRR
jgi:hypothetical protein